MNSLEQQIQHTLKEFFGFDSFKGQQKEIILSILEGNNTFVTMPTGGGKSLCYQLPAIVSEGTAIIISPLIALMKNQVDLIRTFGAKKGFAHFLNSSLTKKEIETVKNDVLSGNTKMLYIAPETFNRDKTIEFLNKTKLSFIAVDEAHCISEWGHDFRPEYRKIREVVDELGKLPIIALTASATPKVREDILINLEIEDARVFMSSFDRPNLYYEVRPKFSQKQAIREIVTYIKKNPGKSGIIYCLTRKKVEEVAETLRLNGIKAIDYHAGMDSAVRNKHQDMFLMEEVEVIVATIAFGMGIDKPDVRYVIHYDVPKSIESYYQETGRAGRDGIASDCILFYNFNDLLKLEKLYRDKQYYEREKANQLLKHMAAFAESSSCRRIDLLHYFGEKYDKPDCEEKKMCSNCRYPKEKFDGKDDVVRILKLVKSLSTEFNLEHLVNIMTGEVNQAILAYQHNKLKEFGSGKDKSFYHWKAIIRKADVEGLIEQNIETMGTISITEKGMEYLKNPYSVMVSVDDSYENIKEEDDEIKIAGGGYDETLFNMLKEIRKSIAKKLNVPPYIVFQDPSLEEMAIKYPITEEELTNITGVSATKAQRYGKEFIKLIAKYVEENEIERPDDLVVKSMPAKSKNKLFIIQNVDKKVPLDEIALAKGLDFHELLDEMESIIYSGHRLNIDYFINENIDIDTQQEIYDYFRNAESDSIEEALKHLGSQYIDTEELRLMRIKFISEMGN
ncbi:MAG: DNA helicase RecQ [Sphingobacteriales bacterium]|nr:DNA helicase RecQ [Sphingobacteriales bacterium]